MRDSARSAVADAELATVPLHHRRIRLGYWLVAMGLSVAVWAKILF